MIKSLLVLLLLSVPLFFQSCTGCGGDDDYAPLKRDEITQTQQQSTATEPVHTQEPAADHTANGKVVVKMHKEDGVRKIKVKINGLEMEFIFDTGASSISISDLEASFLLKQGKITKEDILGTENFEDATGTISEGAIINLKDVTIGERTVHDIKASVVHNIKAPLLFGQTALEKFGKITIDYQNDEIIFE